ncbi:MAG: patatin-like phospholipase family protein, partial [Candidatus Rokubacteria bacterium]|nr:patatin-like phospholipase family protein [Candidatus Rokubacteria bacterium]
ARPRLILNATDLVTGVRFEFSPETFRCLESDLAQYPLGNAVAASSALPGAFASITLQNFGPEAIECLTQRDRQSLSEGTRLVNPVRYARAERRLRYLDRVKTGYVHLSDGGITDNLGLDAFLDLFEGDGAIGQRINQRKLKAVAVISVNATPAAPVNLGKGARSPTVFDVVMRAFDLYLEDAGQATLGDLAASRREKVKFIKDTGRDTRLFFIEVKFDDLSDPKRRARLSAIGTRLSLLESDVDGLIDAGKTLLHAGRGGENQVEIDGLVEVFRSLRR